MTRERIAAGIMAAAPVAGVFWGVLAGLGGTAWLVYLLATGEVGAAVGFVFIGTPILVGVCWLAMMLTAGALFGLAWLFDPETVRS